MRSTPTTPAAASSDLSGLRQAVRGRVFLPGDVDFDDRRLPWNRAVEQPVRAVVEAADADDVAALVRYADEARATIATQPNGHGASGRTEDTILLRTRLLDSIHIDPDARTAHIGAGVRSGELQQAAAEPGLTALPGSSPVVSVTGVALGGGLSWFALCLRGGWPTACGRSTSWMQRGSSDGSPPTPIRNSSGHCEAAAGTTRSSPGWRWGSSRRRPSSEDGCSGRATTREVVVDAFRAVTRTAPVELTLWLELLDFPGGQPLVAIDLTHLGVAAEALPLLEALDALPAPLSDTRRAMTVAELGTITAEPTDPGAGVSRGRAARRPRRRRGGCAALRSHRSVDGASRCGTSAVR